MRVVFDTNIVVSAILTSGTPLRALEIVLNQPNRVWLVTQAIVDEYLNVMRRPHLHVDAATIVKWEHRFESATELVDASSSGAYATLRDQSDIKWLECAEAGKADFLVTGDRDLLEWRQSAPCQILNVAAFLAAIDR